MGEVERHLKTTTKMFMHENNHQAWKKQIGDFTFLLILNKWKIQ
jgi:hypothetical protein